MEPILYADLVAKFRALIADHGLFAEKQLIEYVEGKSRRRLTARERLDLRDVAIQAGAVKQKFDGLVNAHDPCMYRFPVKRRRSGLVGRKQDKHTVDFFTRSTGAEDDAAERKRKASMQLKKGARGGR